MTAPPPEGEPSSNRTQSSGEPDDLPTCGKGLAANSALPATMADLIDSLADNLESHLPAIDQTDPNGTVEHEAYLQLIHAHREIATQLHAAAALMAAHRDLPMAPHHAEAFMDPRIHEAFREYVRLEEVLARKVGAALDQDRVMLNIMDRSSSKGGAA